jgi:hypothetical protein
MRGRPYSARFRAMHRADAVSSARGYARSYIFTGSLGPVLFGWSVPLLLAEPRLPVALLLPVWLFALILTTDHEGSGSRIQMEQG